MNDKELHELNVQLVFSGVSILTIVISMFLLVNEKKYLKKERPIIVPRNADYLSKFNRILILIVALVFLNINYKNKEFSKDDEQSSNLEIIASYLVVISALITLYVVFTSPPSDSTIDVENPII